MISSRVCDRRRRRCHGASKTRVTAPMAPPLTKSSTRTECRPSDQGRFLGLRYMSPTTGQAVAASAAFRYLNPHAPVAQLDRALPSEGRGQGFESLRARHSIKVRSGHMVRSGLDAWVTVYTGDMGMRPIKPRIHRQPEKLTEQIVVDLFRQHPLRVHQGGPSAGSPWRSRLIGPARSSSFRCSYRHAS